MIEPLELPMPSADLIDMLEGVQNRRETLWKALKMTPEEIETAKRACKDVKPPG